jgi:hypothetical protein
MDILFREHPRLPPLSWAAEITPKQVTVHHGSRLEHGPDWLVDGCWPGPFEAGLPEGNVDGFFAFSLRLTENGVIVETPSNPCERISLWSSPERVVVSPSIAFILALTDGAADPSYPDYLHDFFHIIQRISQNEGSVPLAGGETLQVIANRRVTISNQLAVRVEYRPLERSFRSFAEYKAFLQKTLVDVRDNVLSPARRFSYGLASTISSGYDSLMVNVLAAPLGWKDAATFCAEKDSEDSGAQFGPRLGMEVIPIDPASYLQEPNFPEAEFIGTGTRGEDVVFSGGASYFRNKLLLTGTYADYLERDVFGIPNADIYRITTTGCALREFRWRTGFLHVPLAHAGGMGLMSFKAISNSREMKPWSVGGNYDRPISRRIIEEAGFARGSFAAAKRGMIRATFDAPDDRLRLWMNPRSFESLRQFAQKHASCRPLRARLQRLGKYGLYRAERLIGRRLKNAGLLDKTPDLFEERHKSVPGLSSFIFAWSAEILQNRYRVALELN